jgi:hypothetical protein
LSGDIDPEKPPASLLSYLAHLQISYEASYISSITQTPQGYGSDIGRPPIPPRSHSIQTNLRATSNKSSPLAPPQQHPSIFPPHTPHPIPSAAESDRQYVQAQGTPLRSGVWGEGTLTTGSSPSETCALLWSANKFSWVAVFRMSVQVGMKLISCFWVFVRLKHRPCSIHANEAFRSSSLSYRVNDASR